MILYNSCRELPIHNFIELNRTNDLKLLIKKGVYKKQDDLMLQQKYVDIIDEYNSFFKNKSRNPEILNQTKFMILSLKGMNLFIAKTILQTSGKTGDVIKICDLLKINPEEIEIHISATNNELKRLKNLLENQKENDGENDEDSFEKTLTLVKENGFNFDRYTTPVIELIFAINRLDERSNLYKK